MKVMGGVGVWGLGQTKVDLQGVDPEVWGLPETLKTRNPKAAAG